MTRHTADQRYWSQWLQWVMTVTLPLIFLAVNVRLITSHRFVEWEYRRPGFPDDPFGLSTEERIRLAQVCQDYLASNADISLLADLELPNGEPAFNERELRHMEDVQDVYWGLTIAGVVGALLWIGGGIVLGATRRHHAVMPAALVKGSLLTFGLLVAVGAFMLLDWGQFFTAFHRVFFEGDTWIFPRSDTLIRLFPIRFWIDVAAAIVALVVAEATLAGVVGWIWGRN